MLILQQCESVTVFLSAKLTSCGYEPFVQINSTNYTIGKDGFSLHPFQECLWPLPYVSIQKNDYTWTNGEWKKINGSLHISKLELVSRFSDVLLKTYDYLPRHHSIYDHRVEQMNVMSEIISRMQISNTNSLSTLMLDSQSTNDFWNMSKWTNIFKYGILGVISLVLSSIFIYLFVVFFPFQRIISVCRRKTITPTTEDIELTVPLQIPHNHTSTIFDPIKGLCWNDGCVILSPSAPPA